jgi:hypothetical protein
MARSYSSAFKATLNSVSATEAPLVCLEITHPALSQAVRVVNDNLDLTSNGNLFIAAPFDCVLPDDMENQLPKAKLTIDNIGRELVYWLETSGGGEGAKVRFMQIMRSRPNTIEWETTMNLSNVQISMTKVTADLGFENIFSKPAVRIQYRPDNSAGMF